MTNNSRIWQQIVYKTGMWLAVEIWLNIIGLDNIADYSEFVFAQDLASNKKNRRTVKIMQYPPQFCPQIDDFCPIPGTVNKPKDLEHKSSESKAKIFKTKCQQLTKPCVKVMCVSTTIDR